VNGASSPAFQAVVTFALLASGALFAATVQRILTKRAARDAPQLACMAGATALYSLNALLRPARPWGAVLVLGGLLLALAAVVLFVVRRPKR
jgi:hypothetical protein